MFNTVKYGLIALLYSSAICLAVTAQAITSAGVSETEVNACRFTNVSFSSQFASGRLDGCKQVADNRFQLRLKPENIPINPSPWYAFKVTNLTTSSQQLIIELDSGNTNARYTPRVSLDKVTWLTLPYTSKANLMRFSINVTDSPIYIAGGEIIDNIFYTRWLSDIEVGEVFTLGRSVEGRAIPALKHVTPDSNKWLVLLGRQHPPEISGALGLLHFNNLLWSDDPDMVAFRSRFNILLVPNLNPDGVFHGNWRHNANGVDLNRDWKTRQQPETRALHDYLTQLVAAGGEITFALDFHSTWRNVYYTMTANYINTQGKSLAEPQLVNNWLDSLAQVVPYQVENKPSHNPNAGVFKQYIADEFGVHSVTYEVGDQTDRVEIKITAEQALRTLIKLL